MHHKIEHSPSQCPGKAQGGGVSTNLGMADGNHKKQCFSNLPWFR